MLLKNTTDMQNTSYSFLITDDHPTFRQGMRVMLSSFFEGCELNEATTGLELIEMAAAKDFDVILCDIEMPKMNGIEATKKLKSQKPHSRIIGLSMHDDFDNTMLMMLAGARGYFTKSEEVSVMEQAIHAVLSGKYYLNNKALDAVEYMRYMRQYENQFAYIPSVKEMEVLKLLAHGLSRKMIAEKMKISYKTVDTHLQSLHMKTNRHSGTELLMYAKKRGWV